jgi:hypothetical protein
MASTRLPPCAAQLVLLGLYAYWHGVRLMQL